MKIKFFSIFLLLSQLCLGQLNAEFIAMKPLYVRPITFNYTGSMQTWTVPSEVFSILIEAVGAQGGNNGGYIGGKGGKVNAILKVTPGDVLYIVVGGQSTTMNAAYGFGGAGGALVGYSTRFGRAGGGLTGIFSNATVSQANALIVAAGGGGATSYPAATYVDYGAGGGLTGKNGFNNFQYGYGQIWGLGATQTAGGARGIPSDANYILPTAGAALQGGTGGSSNAATSSGWTAGGGGGGGYYGRGGGSAGGNAQGSGGGGSSYAIPSAINVLHTANFRSGHGYLKINY
ncbi:hypothetical protein B0A58_15175 [Flavobacterium branchiophilum NBRC 15030 = ATCC 35035]|uniref:receptor protein-tyrosine kinase n=1 Tax=Flavobacterium branchiophilum TaxID=55197 RepID=A0A543G4L6_9FLAO|nr:glycine-rich protein [Flavobacterium branchiophilum]OXA69806.1 hypothetical protein B0A58_15175 [Flavobacterium branchiophilum NBRC 15030 = ATCC 35035]TQM41028.1 glycine rich protein [Flavobacterium branchiophilum]GEM54691.1 hypothetical protein FB1_09120 [Flavobacterium branchiophilum NBRC 15030 = ATCC 35035]